MTAKVQAEIALISGYLILLCGVIFWTIQPFHLILSLLIEYACLLVVYLYISIGLSKSIWEKLLSTTSHLFSGLALGLVQGTIVMFMAYMLEGKTSFNKSLSDLPWLVLVIGIPMLLLQLLGLRGKIRNEDLQDKKMGELLLSAVTFPAIILSGMLAFEISEEDEHITLITIVAMRITLEIWNNHFKKERGRK
jgi:hypothetical protein